jgi:hypothetical protein
MLRKIFLFFLAIVTIGQAVISVAAMSWLNSTIEVEEVDYFIERSSYRDILIDNQNQLWASSTTSSIDLYQNGQFVRKFTRDEIGSEPGMLILSPEGEVWNIAENISDGMSVSDGQTWTFIGGSKDGTAYDVVNDAVVDRQGRVWLATSTTVYLYENGEWKQFNISNSNIISDGAKVMIVDTNDQIWIGTDKGVAYFDGQNWQVPTGSPAVSVYSLAFAPNGNLWVGSFSDGLFSFDGTTWTRYPVKQNRKNPERYEAVEEILADKYGRVWIHVATDQFYIFDGQSKKYLGGGPAYQVADMFIAPDGLVYVDDSSKVFSISQDTRLLSEFEFSIKSMYDDGLILFSTLLLASIWIITALQAWGMGAGIVLGFVTYIFAAFFDIHGYLNPGCATTLTALAGGLFGYFRRSPRMQRSTVIGSLAGYFSGATIVLCLAGVVGVLILLFSGR